MVIYRRGRRLGEPQLLQATAEYNKLDCSSTRQCRDWLASLRPAEMPWYLYEPEPQKADKVDERPEAEQRVAAMAAALLAGEAGTDPWRQLLVDLLEFHRRASKPAWLAVFWRRSAASPGGQRSGQTCGFRRNT